MDSARGRPKRHREHVRRRVPVRRRVRAPLPSLPCDRLACPTSAGGQGGFGRRGSGAAWCSRIGKLRESPPFSRMTRYCFFVLRRDRLRDSEAFARMTGIAILSTLPWGGSSIGRAPRSHRGGCEFDPHPLHSGQKACQSAGILRFAALCGFVRGCPLYSTDAADQSRGVSPGGHRAL